MENLAPAGNRAALERADAAGADAVYLGYAAFSARAGAGNFDRQALEEAVRYAHFLKPDGIAVINDYEMPSSTVAAGLETYPDGCLEAMEANFRCYTLDASKIAMELGNVKCMNIVLFGAMTKALQLDDIDWEDVIRETVPPKFLELNLAAFRAGRAAAE